MIAKSEIIVQNQALEDQKEFNKTTIYDFKNQFRIVSHVNNNNKNLMLSQ